MKVSNLPNKALILLSDKGQTHIRSLGYKTSLLLWARQVIWYWYLAMHIKTTTFAHLVG